MITTNLTGAFLLFAGLHPSMLKSRWGRIINITSVVGETGQAGQANYAASKAGLIGLIIARSRARDPRHHRQRGRSGHDPDRHDRLLTDDQEGRHVRPIPLGRPGTDAEIAAAVAFLASEDAAYITGHTLDVNGGMHMA